MKNIRSLLALHHVLSKRGSGRETASPFGVLSVL